MCLPGQGVEHAPNGNAGQGTVVVVQAKVDAVKRGCNAQSCRTKARLWGQAQEKPAGGICRLFLITSRWVCLFSHMHIQKKEDVKGGSLFWSSIMSLWWNLAQSQRFNSDKTYCVFTECVISTHTCGRSSHCGKTFSPGHSPCRKLCSHTLFKPHIYPNF